MTISVHNPDRFMADLRTVVAQGRKRLGFLIGAGGPCSVPSPAGAGPLIPAVAGLTSKTLTSLHADYGPILTATAARLPSPNIEAILSRVRALAGVIGADQVNGMDGDGYAELGRRICAEIGGTVDVALPPGENAYRQLVSWITGADRDHPVELFTTNYDLLFEQAFEEVRASYFDGFSGGREPFFDPVSVAANDLPSRWTRLWKLHGSLGWKSNASGEVIRTGQSNTAHLIFPEHLKYDQTQKAPYSALFDRLGNFLQTQDTLLIAAGFSFADAHVSARLDECLSANPSASVFAFQYGTLEDEPCAQALARQRPNFSVYARDQAVINGVAGAWRPGEPPSKDWEPIRATYWGGSDPNSPRFLLGDFGHLARFLALSRSGQAYPVPPAAAPAAVPVA